MSGPTQRGGCQSAAPHQLGELSALDLHRGGARKLVAEQRVGADALEVGQLEVRVADRPERALGVGPARAPDDDAQLFAAQLALAPDEALGEDAQLLARPRLECGLD